MTEQNAEDGLAELEALPEGAGSPGSSADGH